MMEMNQLRELLRERTKCEKQYYICQMTNIDKDSLSRFKTGRYEYLPYESAKRLEEYLTT